MRVPKGLARAIVRRAAPGSFTQHARNPARSVTMGGRCTVLAPAYGSPFVSDAGGGRRYGTLADFQNFVRLAYLSPWLHHSGGTVCEPTDVPVNKRHLDMLYAHMTALRQALHGLGDDRGARRGLHRDVPHSLRRASSSMGTA